MTTRYPLFWPFRESKYLKVTTRHHYAGAPMPFWMRIVGGIGMHKGNLPGYPASHGCIRLPGEMAEAFYGAVSVGTPVRIEQ